MIAPATTPALIRKRYARINDGKFIAAMDHMQFRDSVAIARQMLAKGTPAPIPTIKRRMAKFVGSGIVEGKGQAWRIKLDPQNHVANDNGPIVSIPVDPRKPTLHNECGLTLMRSLPDQSVDLLLTDLPYGITGLSIDPVIDVAEWMAEMRRIVTERGAIVAFAAQPFTSKLVMAAPDLFRQSLVWEKPKPTGFQFARGRHLKSHEDILIFSKGTVIGRRSKRQMTFNPQGAREVERLTKKVRRHDLYLPNLHSSKGPGIAYQGLENCPRTVLRYAKDSYAHHFAKPIALLEYLIRTFSNDDGLVLDPTMGSGSAGVAAINTGRRFIGAENGIDSKGRKIFEIACSRIYQQEAA